MTRNIVESTEIRGRVRALSANLASNIFLLGNLNEALKYARIAVTYGNRTLLRPHGLTGALSTLGWVQFLSGNIDEALRAIEELEKRWPA